MALKAVEAYALAKKYTEDSMEGAGAVRGVPCQIQSITPITGGNRITFSWLDNAGTTHTSTVDIMDGVQGAKGDTGDTGAKGDKGDKGNTGDAATITLGSVTSGESPAITNTGTASAAVFNFTLPKGDKGDKGNKGDDGQDGKSFEIKAQYATYADLIAAHPTGQAGDAYFVGIGTSPDLYTWLSEDEVWYNNGPIAGIKGDKGDTGDDGFSPVASVSKTGTVATVTIRDKTGQTTATINDGAKGDDGDKGDPGEGVPEGGTSGQVLTKKSGTDYDTEWKDPEGGGHTIENDTTALTQRDTLKFEGFGVTDDSTNEKTIVKNPVFVGTTAEWTALSAAEKAKYTLVNLTDDGESGDVVDAVTDGDMRPVTSNAVADKFAWKYIPCAKTPLSTSTSTNATLDTALPLCDEYFLEFEIANGKIYGQVTKDGAQCLLLQSFGNNIYKVYGYGNIVENRTKIQSIITELGSSMTSYTPYITGLYYR